MKVSHIWLSLCLAMSLTVFSCSKDDDESLSENEITTEDENEDLDQISDSPSDAEDQELEEAVGIDNIENSLSDDSDITSLVDEVSSDNIQDLPAENESSSLSSETESTLENQNQDYQSASNESPQYQPSSYEDDHMTEDSRQTSDSNLEGAYVVQPGETLSKIAKRIYKDSSLWQHLAQINNISDPSRIFPGDIIRFPVSSITREFYETYTSVSKDNVVVNRGDSLSGIAKRLLGKASYWPTIWRANPDITNPDVIYSGQSLSYLDPAKVSAALGEADHQETHHETPVGQSVVNDPITTTAEEETNANDPPTEPDPLANSNETTPLNEEQIPDENHLDREDMNADSPEAIPATHSEDSSEIE